MYQRSDSRSNYKEILEKTTSFSGRKALGKPPSGKNKKPEMPPALESKMQYIHSSLKMFMNKKDKSPKKNDSIGKRKRNSEEKSPNCQNISKKKYQFTIKKEESKRKSPGFGMAPGRADATDYNSRTYICTFGGGRC